MLLLPLCALTSLIFRPPIAQGPITIRMFDAENVEIQSQFIPANRVRTKDSKTFSLGRKVYEQGLYAKGNDERVQVRFVIPRGMHSFHADFGVSDDIDTRSCVINQHKIPSCELLIDGVAVKLGEIKLEQAPVSVDLDVTGKRSLFLGLKCGAGIGEPTFSSEPFVGAGRTGIKPVLLSPKDGASAAGDAVHLKWKPVEGAISYGISIVALKLSVAAAVGAPRMWTKTVDATTYSLSLADLPEGQYLWSVIAFGPKEPVGKYSDEWVFTVDH